MKQKKRILLEKIKGAVQRFGNFLERKCRRLVIAAAISVLVLILLGGVLFAVAFLPDGRGIVKVSVPDLREGVEVLDGEYFTVNVLYEYDDSLPAGSFISQYPEAGASRKVIIGERKCNIRVTLSRGARTVVLPNLRGASLADAESKLAELGLSAKVIYVEGESGVLSALPQFGTDVPVGGEVTLYVARGVEGQVPDVVGLSESEAREALSGQGFFDCDAVYIRSSAPAGVVVSQFPLGGTPIGQNKISLTVSRGEG